jgi:hypothetical protein
MQVGDEITTRAQLLELPAGTRLERNTPGGLGGIWRIPNWANAKRQAAEFLAQLERMLPLYVYELPKPVSVTTLPPEIQPDYPAGSQRPQIIADMKRMDEERRSPQVGDYVTTRAQVYALAEHTVLEDKLSRQYEIPNERLDNFIRTQALERLVYALPMKIVYISPTPDWAEEADLQQAKHDWAEGSTVPAQMADALERAFAAGAVWAYAHPRSEA